MELKLFLPYENIVLQLNLFFNICVIGYFCYNKNGMSIKTYLSYKNSIKDFRTGRSFCDIISAIACSGSTSARGESSFMSIAKLCSTAVATSATTHNCKTFFRFYPQSHLQTWKTPF